MCGIFGYTGKKNAKTIAIEGLKKLEYRGYDSAGIAFFDKGNIDFVKQRGKVAELEKAMEKHDSPSHLAIAHTRWATHGKPSEINAHPHLDEISSLAVVHNGIIENYRPLRNMLIEKGFSFKSETDTEVVSHLLSYYYKGDILLAIKEVLALLHGAFSIAVIHKDHPETIFAFALHAPLAIGQGSGEAFISSDPNVFAAFASHVTFLGNGEIAAVSPEKVELYSADLTRIERKMEVFKSTTADITKAGFEHYTLKEIFEQPISISNAIDQRFIDEYGTAVFPGLDMSPSELLSVQRILILACGTSWHAGFLTTYLMEDMARIPTQVEISSEYRYKNPVVVPGTLVIAISQSGETADTIAAVRELKAKGAPVLAICNVESSTLAREADYTLFLHAGPEIGVCSTKAFTSQVVLLALLTLQMARMRHLSKAEGSAFLQALKALPTQVAKVLDIASGIEALAYKYAKYENFFFLGRRYMYPTALEGALKLKEISYINANAYAAGEMKHGPIALISPECPTVAFCANKQTFTKFLGNLMEVKARGGPVIAIAEEGCEGLEGIADDVIFVPDTIDELAAIPSSVAGQLFAYYIAKYRGADIDQPRNLAKSVTVE